MPDHFHGIVFLHHTNDTCRGEPCVRLGSDNINAGEHKVRPYGTSKDSLGRVIQAFKSITTHKYINGVKQRDWAPFPGKLWQRNYWDRIVRNDLELNEIRKYIRNNPAQWKIDDLKQVVAKSN